MTGFLYAELNMMSIVILLMMLFHMLKKRGKHRMPDQKLFNMLIVINLCILIMDALMWIVDGVIFPLAKEIHVIATLFYYILNCVICLFWVLYTDYKLHENSISTVKQMKILIMPLSIYTIIAILSIWTGWFFIIDDSNVYMRGPWFLIMILFTFGFVIYALVLIFHDQRKRGWKSRHNLYYFLVTFPLIVVCSAVLQSLVYGLSIIWVCSSLSLLAIFINIQNNEINTDYLTGLNNRNRIDEFMKIKIQNKSSDSVLFVVMIDVDDFKFINDTYGHSIGDHILIKVSEIFKASCAKNGDFVARLGGDEFMIAGERTSIKDIDKLLRKIHRLVEKYNDSYEIYQSISLSMGYAIYSDTISTLDKLMNCADENMYQVKRLKHKREQ